MPPKDPSWVRVSFGDLAQPVNERVDDPAESGVERYVGLEHLDSESFKIRRWGAPSEVRATKIRFRPGDIILGRRRVYQRKLAVADSEGICSAHAMVLRAKPDIVLSDFLPFFMRSDVFMERALEISVGSLSPTINWKTLAKQEFELPSIEDQQQLTPILQALNRNVEALEDLHREAVTLHGSLRRHLFASGLYSDGHSSKAGHSGSSQVRRWSTVPLGELTESLDGKRVPLKGSERAKRVGPYPYYGASGVIDHIDEYIFDEELLLISEDGANLTERKLPVAFVVDGKYWVNNHAHVVRSISGYTHFLLAEYLESISLKPFITGTAQPKLTKEGYEAIPFPNPPAEELRQIESILRRSIEAMEAVSQRRAVAKDLFNAAMTRFVAGAAQ